MTTLNLEYIYGYLLVINILTFALFGLKKHFDEQGRPRIQEWPLLVLAVIGGSMGAFFAVYIFTYKKDQKIFKYGILALYTIQLFICAHFGVL